MGNFKYFLWRQNNSGGLFKDPGKYVLIQAPTETLAVAIFKELYFDDSSDCECECCGPRWSVDYYEEIPLAHPDYGFYTLMKHKSIIGIMEYNLSEVRDTTPILFVHLWDGSTASLSWTFNKAT